MNIFDPHITGSLSVSASANIQGDLVVGGTIYGTAQIQGQVQSAVSASHAASYLLTSSFEQYSGSFAITGSNVFRGDQTISGSLLPEGTLTHDIGSDGKRWRDIYLAGNTIDLGGTKLSKTDVGDLEIKDGSNNLKKIVASEIELGSGNGKKVLKVSNGKLKLTDLVGGADEAAALSGSFTGSFRGDGSLLTNVPASSVTGLNLARISNTTATASISNAGLITNVSVIPETTDTIDLGSPTKQWRDLYLSSGSLYINGQQVLSTTGTELRVTTDSGESIKILETGSDTITLQTVDGDITLTASGNGNIELDAPVQIASGKKILSSDGNSIVFANGLIITGSIDLIGTVDGVEVSLLYSNFNSYTSSNNNTNSSQNNRLSSLETFTGSLDATYATDSDVTSLRTTLNTYTSSNNTTNTTQNSRLISLETKTGSLNSDIILLDGRVDSLELESGSIRTNFNTYTSSNDGRNATQDGRLNTLESFKNTISSYTASNDNTNSTQNSRLSSLETTSGSLINRVGDLETFETKVDTGLEFTGSNVTIKGDLLVKGTQTRVNSTTVDISDNIISLNGSGAANAGIEVRDMTSPGLLSGSLLWDGVNNYWIGGPKDSEERLLTDSDLTTLDGRLDSLETESGSVRTAFNSYTSSNDGRNSTQDGRLNSLESSRTSLNSFTSSASGRLSSIESFTGSIDATYATDQDVTNLRTTLNTYTSSNDGKNSTQDNRLGSLESSRTSLNSFTSSASNKFNSLELFTSSIDLTYATDEDVNRLRGDLNDYTTSNDSTNTTQNNRLTSLETSRTSINLFTGSAAGRLNQLETQSGSIRTDFNTYTSSNNNTNSTQNSRLSSLETFTGSLDATYATDEDVNRLRGDFNDYTSSNATTIGNIANDISTLDGRVDSLESFTASIDATYATDSDVTVLRNTLNSYTSSNNTTNNTQNSRLSSIELTTGSFDGRLDSIETFTGSLDATYATDSDVTTLRNSFNTYTGSNNTTNSSQNSRLTSLESVTGSYLTSHPSVSAAGSSNNSGRTYIQDIILDQYGHITGLSTATETVVNTDTNYYTTGATFNTSNGIITGTRNDGGTWTVDIDGRFLPLAGGTMSGTLDMGNFNITNINALAFADPGPNEGITWTGGNGFSIYESPNDLTTNTSGNLQFVVSGARAFTLNSNKTVEFLGNITAPSFIKSGGTSAQFLKADGSVDSSTYLTQHPTVVASSSSNNSGRTYIQDILLDSFGHITGITTATETVVNTDQYTTGATWNGTTATLTFTRNNGGTYSIQMLETLSDVTVTGGTYNSGTQTLRLTKSDGSTVDVSGFAVDTDVNWYTTGATFNTSNGIITGTRNDGGTWTVDIDGKYSDLGHTHDDRYYTESESDSRFVNVAGDTMSGTFYVNAPTGINLSDSGNNATFHQFESYWNTNAGSSVATYRFDVGTFRIWSLGTGAPVFQISSAGAVSIPGTLGVTGNFTTSGTVTATGGNSSQWNTAYGWGDHGTRGYLTAHPSVSAASSSNNSGRTYIQDILLDSFGHITGITTGTETVVNTDEYTTGATFNTSNGVITFTRNDGDTFTVDIDGKYAESVHTHDDRYYTKSDSDSRYQDATDRKKWTAISASGTQAKRYRIARVYYCPKHWDDTWQNIEFELLEETYNSGYVRYNLFGYYNGTENQTLNLQVTDFRGLNSDTSRYNMSLGAHTDTGWLHSGQKVYYTDVYVDVSYYKILKITADTFGHSYQNTDPTAGAAITVFYDNPDVQDITYTNVTKQNTYVGENSVIWNSSNFSSTNINNWDTAYGWGDHSTRGYLTSFDITTQTDGRYLRSDSNDTASGNLYFSSSYNRFNTGNSNNTSSADTVGLHLHQAGYTDGRYTTRLRKYDHGGGVPLYIDNSAGTANVFTAVARFGTYSGNGYGFEVFGAARINGDLASSGQINASGGNSSQWNTAYGWGNHAAYGYLTQHPTIAAAPSSNNSGRTYIQDILLDSNGHITGITTATETVVNTDTDTITRVGISGSETTGTVTLTTSGSSSISQVGSTVTISSTNNYLNAVSWNSSTGVITFGREGLNSLTLDIDGKYAESGHSHNVYDLNNFNTGQDPNTYSQTRFWSSLNGGTAGNYPSAYNGVVNLGMDASHGLQFSYHYGATDDALWFRHKSDNPSAPNGVGWQGWQRLASQSWVSSRGYLTAHPSVSAASSSNNSGRTYIQDILLDSYGHITGITTATETVTDTNYYTTSAAFNTSTGVITGTRNDGGTWTVDIDGRYLTSYTETDTLQSVTNRGSSTTNNIYINNTNPTLFLQDTDNRSAMVHVNSNYFYILNGSANNSTGWAQQANSRWLFQGNLSNNDITFGGAGDFAGVVTATGGNSSQWNTAYGWGNHASAGYLTSYTDTNYYTTGSTFNSGTGILTFTRNDGGTYTVNIAATLTDVTVTGGTYNSSNQTLTLTKSNGTTVSVSGFAIDTDVNWYTTSASFNTGNGIITGTRNDGGTWTVDIDGKYLDLSGGTLTGNLTVGATNRTSDTVVQSLADQGYKAGFEAYGNGQGTGYLYVGQSADYGGGISYNGDGSPAFVNGETSDYITFYRREAGTNTEVFAFPYSGNNVYFNGEVHAGGGNSSQWNTAVSWGNHAGLYAAASHTHSEYLKYNPDGDGIAISYDDSNPTVNGTAIGGGHWFGADGSTSGGYLAAKILHAEGSTSSIGGYFTGAMNISAGGNSTQVIDGSGNWVGNAIGDSKISSSGNWNTAYGWGNHASAGYIVKGSTVAHSASWSTATKFQSGGDISQSAGNHTLQIYAATNNDAFMAFHISGDYAVHFGLDDATNRLHVGGWSDGTGTKYQLWDSRDFSSTNIGNWNTAYNKRVTSASLSSSTLTITAGDGTTVTASVPTFNQNTTGNAATVTINYNNDSNSTYQMLWGSGNSVFGTAGVYVNPSTDYVTATSFNASDWFRSSGATGWYNSTYGGGWYMTDSSYVRPYNSKSIHMGNASIDYVTQLHFNDNVRFYDEGNNNYLNYKWGNSGAGGIKFVDGDGSLQGYVYGSGTGSFGLLDGSGNWKIRLDTSDVEMYGTQYLTTVYAYTMYDRNNSAYYVNPAESSNLSTLTLNSPSAGSTVLNIQGTSGQLFSITDDLTGDLFSISDASGVPIFKVNAGGSVTMDNLSSFYVGNNKVINGSGNIVFDGVPTTTNQGRGIYWTGYDKEGTTDPSDNAHILHTVNSGGLAGSVLEIKSHNDSNDGVNFVTNSNDGVRINGNIIVNAANYTSYQVDTDRYVNSASFNTGNGVLTLTRAGSDSATVTVDLDGRYLESLSGAVLTTYNSSLNSDSRNSRGVTRLYRRDDDSDYSVQTYWTGSYWFLKGYNGDTYHAGVQVSYADSAGTADNIDGWAFRNTGGNTTINADTLDSNGITYYTAGVTNFSGNATDGALYSQRHDSNWQHQIAGDYRSGQIAVRGKNAGTWQSWKKVALVNTTTFSSVTSVTFTHGLGTDNVIVQVYDSGGSLFFPSELRSAGGVVTATFEVARSGRLVVTG